MKHFGRRLKRARMAAGYASAQQFAGVLGLEPHSYRKYERGQAEPNFENLVRICETLNVSLDELIPIERRQPPSGGPHGGTRQAA
jgi:transcriptional regulator with XRE-family HTH domain